MQVECGETYKMVYMTMIARVADGLPLAASIQEDEQASNILCYEKNLNLLVLLITCHHDAKSSKSTFQMGKNIVDYQQQAKRLFKTLTATSPIKCSIESGPYLFQ